jgi:hypothetical protein
MNEQTRMAIRAAVFIHQHLSGRNTQADAIRLPEHPWQQIQRLKRQAVRAHERGWQLAEKALFRDFADTLRRFQYELEGSVRQVQTRLEPHPEVSPVELYRDVLALTQEFDGFEIDYENHELAVTTDPIVLEGIDLGRFEIRLDWSQMGSCQQPYHVVALDPHSAAHNEEVTHPHVQGERLCEGDGRAAIASALTDCRLYDFFTLVSQVLHTYGKGSAFVELDKWNGIPCDGCGDIVDDEDRYSCQRCGNTLCPSCAVSCRRCEDSYCSECLRQCAACGEEYCSSCLRVCSVCRKRFCDDCLEEGLCRSCYEKTHEEDQDDDPADDFPCEEPCPAGQAQAEPATASV